MKTSNDTFVIDIGGSAIKFGVVDKDGFLIFSDCFTVDNYDIKDIIEKISYHLDKALTMYNIVKIGISAPGTIDREKNIITGTVSVPAIKEQGWIDILKNRYNLPISIDNDANCSTKAELYFGNAKHHKNVINIVIGTGIGSTLVVDGEIVYGSNKYGSELGYITYEIDGNYVYSSEFLSTKALVNRVCAVRHVSNAIEVFALIETDENVYDVYKSYVRDLGLFIYNVVHMYDPELVLIGGAISNNERLIEDIKFEYEQVRTKMNMSDIKLNIRSCMFNNDANLIGASIFDMDI